MIYNEFNKANLKNLRAELQEVLDKYESNLKITVGNMSFSSNEVKITINAQIEGTQTYNESIIESIAKANGMILEKNGNKLVEYHHRKYKMPFIYIGSDGKRYKTTHERAKQLFAA